MLIVVLAIFAVLVCFTSILAVPLAIIIAVSTLFEREDLVRIAVSELTTAGMSAISLAMGLALYGLIVIARGVAPVPAS